jgi:hypothetical protein
MMSNLYAQHVKTAKKKLSVKEFHEPKFGPGRTKQSFKDACDVNKILKKHGIKNAQAHVVQYPPEYYEQFEGQDLLQSYQLIEKANEVFDRLPSEVRSEFGNNALAFAGFASDPNNRGRLEELMPAIAEPGTYFPNPVSRGAGGAGAATPPSSVQTTSEASDAAASSAEGASPSEAPSGAS